MSRFIVGALVVTVVGGINLPFGPGSRALPPPPPTQAITQLQTKAKNSPLLQRARNALLNRNALPTRTPSKRAKHRKPAGKTPAKGGKTPAKRTPSKRTPSKRTPSKRRQRKRPEKQDGKKPARKTDRSRKTGRRGARKGGRKGGPGRPGGRTGRGGTKRPAARNGKRGRRPHGRHGARGGRRENRGHSRGTGTRSRGNAGQGQNPGKAGQKGRNGFLGQAEILEIAEGKRQLNIEHLDSSQGLGKVIMDILRPAFQDAVKEYEEAQRRRKRSLGSYRRFRRQLSSFTEATGELKGANVDVSRIPGAASNLKKAFKFITFKVEKKKTDMLGDEHYRLGVYIKDIRLLGGDVIYSVHAAREVSQEDTEPELPVRRSQSRGRGKKSSGGKKKKLEARDSLRGSFQTSTDMEVPELDMSKARSMTKDFRDKMQSNRRQRFGKDFQFIQRRTESRYVILPTKDGLKLAVEGRMFGQKKNRGASTRPFVYMDVETGEVLEEYEALAEAKVVPGIGGNKLVGQKEYSTDDALTLRLTKSGDRCYYQTDNVVVYKINGDGASETKPYNIDCGDVEKDEINGAYAPASDAMFNIDALVDFYVGRYGEKPLGDQRVTIEVQGADEDNAAWTGETLLLHNGKDVFHPLTVPDVSAHELGHGIVEANSELEYRKESGGINEAFSDMTGKLASTYIKGLSEPEDWEIGAGVMKSGKALRYMDKPSQDGKSIDAYGDYTEETAVHYSSGLFNRVFSILSQKPSFTLWEAYDVFYLANMFYWRSTTTFLEGAESALRTLCEMREGRLLSYDYTHLEQSEAIAAFSEVGISCQDMDQECKHTCSSG